MEKKRRTQFYMDTTMPVALWISFLGVSSVVDIWITYSVLPISPSEFVKRFFKK